MRSAIAGVLVGLAALLMLDAAFVRLALAPGVLPDLGPPAWITSRAAGVAALVALTTDVVFGLFVSTGALNRWCARGRSVELHRWLSAVTLGLVGLHAFILGADRFVRLDALDATIPFLSAYERLAVGLGVLTAYGALFVHASFGWIGRISGYAWRKIHYVSFVVFAAAIVHALLLSKSDGVTRAVAGAGLIAVLPLGLQRVIQSARTRASSPSRSLG